MLLNKIQEQLETIYQLPRHFSIEDFLINQETLEKLKRQPCNLPAAHNRKGLMLLLAEGSELRVAIYLHDQVLKNLYAHNPCSGLNEKKK